MASYTKKNNNTHTSCNHEEHESWNRRSFIQALGLVGGGTMALANSAISASKPSPLSMALDQAETDNVLILIRLKGGNDGLNTIIPIYDYDTYASVRPNIKIAQNNMFKLGDDFGMASYANKLEKLWGDGQMKVVNGIGYENSTLSHFNGSDIWGLATTDLTETSGWLGRYFEEQYPDYLLNPPTKPTAIQIGGVNNLVFDGSETNYAFTVGNTDRLAQIAASGDLYDITNLPDCRYGEKVGFIKGVANTTFSYAGVINEAYEKSSDYGTYPDNSLASQLSVISRLIKGGLGSKIYMVSIGGFDTHNNQNARQGELLTELSETIGHFYEDLGAAGWDDKVLSMTISEFGRRVKENGSQGTDHGRASNCMLFGSGLNGNGFVGEHPDLSDADRNGNLSYTTDFRSVYTTVLKEWLCADANLVDQALLGQDYDTLDLGFSCDSSLGVDDQIVPKSLSHMVTYDNDQSFIHINNIRSAHVAVTLYTISGQKVATITNEMLLEGNHVINVREASKTPLSGGLYIYRISTNNDKFSSKIMIM